MIIINLKMGNMANRTYVKGGGSHHNVPVPLTSKIDLYRSSKRLDSQNGLSAATISRQFDPRSHKKIEWDIYPISEEGYDTVKYEVKKLATRSKIDMSII